MIEQAIESTMDWLDNGGLPWFIGTVMMFYAAATAVIRWMPVDEIDG